MTETPSNPYMSREDLLSYVKSRLSPRTPLRVPNNPLNSAETIAVVAVESVTQRAPGPRRKRIGQALVDFWTGVDCRPDTLNKYILLTARMLRYEVAEEQAVDVLERYCAEHPAPGFSDRLSAGRHSEVSRVIRETVRAVYAVNGGQPEPVRSRRILDRAHAFFQRVGFEVGDKSTWERLLWNRRKLVADFAWSPEEVKLISETIVPILKTSLDTSLRATKHFIRFVKGHEDREISRDSLPTILRNFDLNIRKSQKKSDFLQQLLALGWIAISKEHEWYQRGSGRKGKARQYVVGPALVHKFQPAQPDSTTGPATATATAPSYREHS